MLIVVGICLGCVDTSCDQQLKDCNADCDCKSAVEGVLSCVLAGGQILTCGAGITGLPGNAGQLAQNLGLCLYASCRAQCAPGFSLDGGKDGAANDANDDGG